MFAAIQKPSLIITQEINTTNGASIKQPTKFRIRQLLFPADSRKDHFKALDGLRGLAVLLVILSHASIDNVFLFPGADFTGMGKPGVFLFFVLSAYLLDRQIIVGFVSGRANKRFWANYFLRRFMRIFPMYIIALLIFYGCYKAGFATPIHDLPTIWKHLTLQEGFGIFWSIAVEFKYYFLSPLIMAFCHYVLKWDLKKVTIFLVALMGISVYLQAKYKFDEITLVRYLPVFLLGTLLSIYEVLLEKKTDLKTFKSNALEYAGWLCLLLIIISIPSVYAKLFLSEGQKYPLSDSIFYVPYAIVWSVILLAAKYGSKQYLKRFFQLTAMRILGVISFSAYLFHLLVLKVVEIKKLHIPHYAQCYVFLLLVGISCLISYLVIERNLQKVRIKY
jgi:peptidoglycan/LPS O-acetylase OafA/YrhL